MLECGHEGLVVRTELPAQIGTIVDIAPIQGSGRSDWLLLAADNALVRLDADTREWTQLARATLHPESDREPSNGHRSKPRLHVSQRGEFAAVVNDYGRYGQIIDLQSGEVTLALDGGEYHEDTVPFSFAFAQLRGRTVAIHRTEWNRLELSDPVTGALLAGRGRTDHVEEQQSYKDPEHPLDYFHGALYVSPQSSHILDDGWVWHPMGIPTTWSLDRWMFTNVWESENGPTLQHVCAPRAYHWGGGACWIDERRLALAGIGDDDEVMIDGARVFDITVQDVSSPDWRQARELLVFPGPAGEFFSDGTALFSAGETGLFRWSLNDGAQTGFLEGFRPTHQHRGAGELVQRIDRTLVRWSGMNPSGG